MTDLLEGFGEPADAAAATDSDHPHPGQWRLRRVEVSNWGTFHGTHTVEVSPKGYFLTGGPGSGKSTLLDGISALLTPPRGLHFNAAASDAGPRSAKNRRTVASYVRGAWATHYDPGTGEFTQEVLRPGTTMSVLTLRYADGTGRTAQLTRIMLLASGHSSDSDVKNLYVISPEPLDVRDLQHYVGTQIEARSLEQDRPGVQTFRKFREYRAAFCQLLGIPDEKALGLLHKIQSAKELGDINSLLRDYMLEEPKTFDLADQALRNFQNLSEVYQALRTAREQRDVLRRVASAHERWDATRTRGGELVDRRADIDVFAAQHLVRLLEDDQENLQLEVDRSTAAQNRLTAEVEDARNDLVQLKEQRRTVGGGEIDDWKQQIAGLEVERDRRKERATDVAAQLATLELRTPLSEDMFLAVQRDVTDLRTRLEQEEKDFAQRRWDAEAEVRRLASDIQTVRDELGSLSRRTSNMPAEDLDQRDAIAAELGLPSSAFPFAAELMQVRAGEEDWTAAAEQALSSLARSILVPDRFYRDFADWVNSHRTRRRISYNRISTDHTWPSVRTAPEALSTKLEVQAGEFSPWLTHELASRFDYACVESMDAFRRSDRAVTMAGQIKHSATRHVKNADRFISNRSTWVLGFDNQAKRTVYEADRDAAEKQLFEAQEKRKDLENEALTRRDRLYATGALQTVAWDDIDAATVARRIANLRDMVRAAESGSDQLTAIANQIQDVEQSVADGDAELRDVLTKHGRLTEQQERATARLAQARTTVAQTTLAEETVADLTERFHAISPTLTIATIDRVVKDVSSTLDAELVQLTRETGRAEEDIRTGLREFGRRWPAEVADTEASVEAVEDHLEILRTLEEERLPEVEERFFTFFTHNTLSDVQALATAIAREPAEIRKRLEKINALLRQVEFHRGRFLQLSMRPVHLAALDEFKRALGEAASDTLENDITGDRDRAEERFLSLEYLMGLLTDARTKEDQTSRAILDTRRHVHFHAEEADESGTVVHAHESGGPLSGGQNERLTTFCLAAALRYQLAGTGAEVPRYALIIIDEAFSKGAGKFITAAMESFRHFGFQVLLANPGKNPQALAPFIGGVGVVSIREDRFSSVAPIEFVPVD